MWEGLRIKSSGKLSTNFQKVDFKSSGMRRLKVRKTSDRNLEALVNVKVRMEVFKIECDSTAIFDRSEILFHSYLLIDESYSYTLNIRYSYLLAISTKGKYISIINII